MNVSESPDNLLVPKLCGADIEVGNFVTGVDSRNGTGAFASRALLAEIEGLPLPGTFECACQQCRAVRNSRPKKGSTARNRAKKIEDLNPQDWGRKYLPANGGCAYIDLNHLELCLPEVISAFDHVACWHAMLRIARRALTNANEKLPHSKQIEVLINNSDGRGNSYGSHLNFLVTRRTWNNLFNRKLHYLLYLASFQASSIIFTGQGKVGSENGAEPVEFQISQRADFFETLMGEQTTRHRPIVNSRDESLCGRFSGSEEKTLARLHAIFFDNTLAQVTSLLKVGVMQIVLSMIETESVNPELVLDDPVAAVVAWSHDPTLQTRARLASGPGLTALELQFLFLEEAKRFVARGGCDQSVPRVEEIMALWEDTLLKLQARDWPALAKRLDWVLKLMILEKVLAERPELDWNTPQLKHLDHAYANLDLSAGLYWAYEHSGFVQRVVTEEHVEHFTANPPDDTRAWTRAMLLRSVEPEVLDDVNWDSIAFKQPKQRGRTRWRRIEMPNPLLFTKATTESVFAESESLDQLLDALNSSSEIESAKRPRGNGRSEVAPALMGMAN